MRSKTVLALALALLAGLASAADLPRKAPELSVKLSDGGQVLESSYKGKVLCVAFILTT